MTFDPTTNRVPFGFLTPDEHESLRAWPHGWQYYDPDFEYWAESKGDIWVNSFVYRGKPAPVVIRRWAAIYPRGSTGSWRDTVHDVKKVSGADMIGIIQLDITDGVPSVCIIKVPR